jgi:dUTP pyrophosphatase
MIRWYNPDPNYVFERKTEGASGFDVSAANSVERAVPAGGRFVFSTGLHLAIPLGIEAQVRSRSGLARDHGLVVAPGTIDSDYRGEILVTLFNHGNTAYVVHPGQRIAQIVFAPVWPQIVYLIDQLDQVDGKLAEIGAVLGNSMLVAVDRVRHVKDLGETARGARGHGSTGL